MPIPSSLFVLLLASTASHAQFGDIFKKKDPNTASQPTFGSLTNDKITAGLKGALQVSTANAVALTGKPDEFLKNDAIRIPLTEKLNTVGRGLRMIGMGSQVDELEVGMNRAAEQATPKAKAIFLAELKKMTNDVTLTIYPCVPGHEIVGRIKGGSKASRRQLVTANLVNRAAVGCLVDSERTCEVGAPAKPLAISAFGLLLKRRKFLGSSIGSIAETQEMFDFCGKETPSDSWNIRFKMCAHS